MKDLKDFTSHVKTVSRKQWETLFLLIPELDNTQVFGVLSESKQLQDGSYTFPYWIEAEITSRTSEIILSLDILPVFDWMKWDEGRELLNSHSDLTNLDIITLCMLLTYIYRLGRFSDGAVISYFKSGTVIKILKALKNHIDKNNIKDIII